MRAGDTKEEALTPTVEASPELSEEQLAEQDENYLLIQYQAHVDRAVKLTSLMSGNAVRRVFLGYLKSGINGDPKLMDAEERELYGRTIALQDVKYALISKAIDKAAKSAKEGENNEQQQG